MNEPNSHRLTPANGGVWRYPGIGQALLLLLLWIGISVAGTIALVVVDFASGGRVSASPIALRVFEALAYGTIVWYAFRKMDRPLREVFPLTPFHPHLLLPLVPLLIGLGILLSDVDNVTRWYLPMPEFLAEMMGEAFGRDIAGVTLLVIVGPVAEELLFRGIILRGFLNRYAVPKAIVGSSIIFALFHLNPYQFAAAFSFGLLAGWLYLGTRSLPLCIATHSLYNAHLWAVVHLLSVNVPGYSTGTGSPAWTAVELQPLWFDALGMVLLVGGIVLLRRRLQTLGWMTTIG